ncbi:DedA family protein [Bacillus cereus group sp. TH152-1LC]|uniref:DedA family protein n=1 Tax=Bacillus cereus group sp. TH152-1LC TaxID=3018060 RepID=UPI0022E711D9|nr:DedA family protein [Bacillus cereus group sp. TH152-1LC]MDA1675071.1 DedA family protein [Bacillus cereus group sp. TH152-1LC]
MEHIIQFIDFLKQFSYLGIIILLTSETIPSEIILPMVGYWVYQGDMNFYLAVLSGVIGGTTGPLGLYAISRFGGRPFILKYGKYLLIKEKHIDASDVFFQKYGYIVAFIGRFIPGIRTAICIPCGISKMNAWLFGLYTIMAMIPISTLYVYLGRKLGENWSKVGPTLSTYLTPIGISIFILLIIYIIIKFLKSKK